MERHTEESPTHAVKLEQSTEHWLRQHKNSFTSIQHICYYSTTHRNNLLLHLQWLAVYSQSTPSRCPPSPLPHRLALSAGSVSVSALWSLLGSGPSAGCCSCQLCWSSCGRIWLIHSEVSSWALSWMKLLCNVLKTEPVNINLHALHVHLYVASHNFRKRKAAHCCIVYILLKEEKPECCAGLRAVDVFRTNDGHFHMSFKIGNVNLICLSYTTLHLPVALPCFQRSWDNLTYNQISSHTNAFYGKTELVWAFIVCLVSPVRFMQLVNGTVS